MQKILAVDDNENNLLAIKRPLSRAGYDLLFAQSGAEGLALLEREPVDLILLDWMMPKMTGLEVLTTLRNDTRFERIPVIMLTARKERDDIIGCRLLGVSGYIIKPFHAPALLAQIEKTLADSP